MLEYSEHNILFLGVTLVLHLRRCLDIVCLSSCSLSPCGQAALLLQQMVPSGTGWVPDPPMFDHSRDNHCLRLVLFG